MSLLCRLKKLVHKGELEEKDLDRIVIIPKGQEPCEDCISRQEAIDKMQELEDKDIEDYGCSIPECFDGKRAIEALKALPSIQPKPKTGHWVEVIDEIDRFGNKTWHHECSICGNGDSGWGTYKYCPDCGAKMEDYEET